MEDTFLTIAERLKDLRKERGMTLEALAKEVRVSRSALGTYETGEFKDISPFSIVKLAKFYGVTTDYLMGVSGIKGRADAEIQELRLTDDALTVLKNGRFNGTLLSEVICHRSFQRLMTDMEIFVDGIASMQIDNLNRFMGTARKAVQTRYGPDENELFYRTFELAQIPGDAYVGSVLREDLTGILHDIREAHQESAKNKTVTSVPALMEDFQKNVQAVMEGKGSREEQSARTYLATFGIDYDRLTPEEFVVLIGILKKSRFAKNSINRRGRKPSASRQKSKK